MEESMKKSEKIIAALATIAIGILVIILRGGLIKIVTSVLGVGLIVYGILDLIHHKVPPAIVKLVAGVIVLVCGLAVVEIVLYLIAAFLLIVGILSFYDKYKEKRGCKNWKEALYVYTMPALCLIMGILLLFNQGATVDWIFVVCGILSVIEGGMWLINALAND